MRFSNPRWLAFALVVLGLAVLVGCAAGRRRARSADDEEDDYKGGKSSRAAAAVVERKPIKVTEAGTIKGKITLEGGMPDLTKLTSELQANMKQDRDYCLNGSPGSPTSPVEKSEQEYRIGDNKQVGNVFVWIEPENRGESYFEIPETQLKAVSKDVVIHQPHCAFVPHCAVVFTRYVADSKGTAKETGQKLEVVNDAHVSHNTKVQGGPANPEKNETLKEGAKLIYDAKPDRDPITISCSIHPWMRGYVRAFNHPYAAVSLAKENAGDADYGTYEIKGVPAGATVLIFAWHETAGFLSSPKGDKVTLEKETVKDFKLTPK
jgi:hypothetical protein